ncbi:hypothetical protein [Xanthomonas arboricola]|uniref:hypothetical protein n=1 Tax=Xanthomonas arboricola TaxID=56448 RepID=UPI000CEE26EA|nr:hypothetical protein [Xanthomonas arboricola]PPU28673.1 hypothetical protein XarCFBP6762_05330 [Xanthomonas arboricola]
MKIPERLPAQLTQLGDSILVELPSLGSQDLFDQAELFESLDVLFGNRINSRSNCKSRQAVEFFFREIAHIHLLGRIRGSGKARINPAAPSTALGGVPLVGNATKGCVA